MIPLVNTAVVGGVGADESDPTVALNPPLHIGKNMHRIVWEMGHLPERMKSYGKDR